jgi:hypothetical protein
MSVLSFAFEPSDLQVGLQSGLPILLHPVPKDLQDTPGFLGRVEDIQAHLERGPGGLAS